MAEEQELPGMRFYNLMPPKYGVKDGAMTYATWLKKHIGHIEGIVPPDIVDEGPDCIRAYVDEQIALRDAELDRADDEYRARMQAISIPLSVRHEEVTLVGRIVYHTVNGLSGVRYLLEEPEEFISSEHVTSYGFRRSGGLFTHHGDLKPEFIKRGEEILVRLYLGCKSRAEHPRLHALTNELNQKR